MMFNPEYEELSRYRKCRLVPPQDVNYESVDPGSCDREQQQLLKVVCDRPDGQGKKSVCLTRQSIIDQYQHFVAPIGVEPRWPFNNEIMTSDDEMMFLQMLFGADEDTARKQVEYLNTVVREKQRKMRQAEDKARIAQLLVQERSVMEQEFEHRCAKLKHQQQPAVFPLADQQYREYHNHKSSATTTTGQTAAKKKTISLSEEDQNNSTFTTAVPLFPPESPIKTPSENNPVRRILKPIIRRTVRFEECEVSSRGGGGGGGSGNSGGGKRSIEDVLDK